MLSQKTCHLHHFIYGFRVKSMKCKMPLQGSLYFSVFLFS
ncbi:hypothetical protein GALL_166010 [mine drainage metagenome]|uniref:Uncharacterized protein n=1 Tax=mine drainage metagenome TaxID=410659 RepID=A0A1J5RYV3_9ZZZZ